MLLLASSSLAHVNQTVCSLQHTMMYHKVHTHTSCVVYYLLIGGTQPVCSFVQEYSVTDDAHRNQPKFASKHTQDCKVASRNHLERAGLCQFFRSFSLDPRPPATF